MGSNFVARRAGTQHASNVMTYSKTTTITPDSILEGPATTDKGEVV